MSDTGKVIKDVARAGAAIFTAGTSELLFAALDSTKPDKPMSAREIEAKAKEESRKRRSAKAKQIKEKGQTIFTSPTGVMGMQLKDKFGQ